MSLLPTSPIQRIRWLKCKNAGGQTVPPYGVLNCSDTQNGVLMVGPPTSDNQTGVFVNSQQPIQPNGYGSCTSDSPCYVAYNSQAGTPAAGQAWGTQAGFFYLNPNQTGFTIRGDAVATPFPRVLADHGGGGGGGGSGNSIQTQLSDNSVVIPNTRNLEFDAATFAMQDFGSGNAIVFGSRGFQPIIGCRVAIGRGSLLLSDDDPLPFWNAGANTPLPGQIVFGDCFQYPQPPDLLSWVDPVFGKPNRITFPYTGYYLVSGGFVASPATLFDDSWCQVLFTFYSSQNPRVGLDIFAIALPVFPSNVDDGQSLSVNASFGLIYRNAGDYAQAEIDSSFEDSWLYSALFSAYMVGVNPGGGGVNPTGA